jgi:hypothetical protein
MKINEKLITTLTAGKEDELLATILRMALQTNGKEKQLKLDNDQLAKFLGYGRDKNDQVLNGLISKKWITREQTRDEKGNFDFNIITVTCPFIS